MTEVSLPLRRTTNERVQVYVTQLVESAVEETVGTSAGNKDKAAELWWEKDEFYAAFLKGQA